MLVENITLSSRGSHRDFAHMNSMNDGQPWFWTPNLMAKGFFVLIFEAQRNMGNTTVEKTSISYNNNGIDWINFIRYLLCMSFKKIFMHHWKRQVPVPVMMPGIVCLRKLFNMAFHNLFCSVNHNLHTPS